MSAVGELRAALAGGLENLENLEAHIRRFQKTVWNTPVSDEVEFEAEMEVLADLACDLEYFVLDPSHRAEDPSYFGPERAVREIRDAFAKLEDLRRGR